jgi:hypothetical protein
MGKRAASSKTEAAGLLGEAIAFYESGRIAEAGRICGAILAREPENFGALLISGMVRFQLGDHAEALRLVGAALKVNPGSIDAAVNHGVILDALQRYDEALASYDRVLATSAGNANLHYNRGNALKKLNRFDDASASYDAAIAMVPDFIPAHINRSSVLALNHRNQEALESVDRALALIAASGAPGESRDQVFAALLIRGKVLTRLKRHDEALASYDQALALKPNQTDALANRAGVLADLGHYDEAMKGLDLALRLDPNSFDARLNRGNLNAILCRMQDAVVDFAAADQIRRDDPDANFNAALALLCLGRFEEGWRKYEYRFKQPHRTVTLPKFPRPLWRGDKGELAGKTILLAAEQGLGDAIQFARYAPLIAACGARVVLGVHRPLARLLRSVPGVAQVVADGEQLPEFDLYSSLLSLPGAFKTELATIPSTVPYLRTDDALVAQWRDRIPQQGRLRVGVCWSGSTFHAGDRRRSLSLDQFAPILSVAGIDFISLQKDVRDADAARLRDFGVNQLGQEFADFADTAAVMTHLDLVISVDTSVAHLAGAMAKAVAVLIGFSPDWRWMLNRSDTPWYPTMRLVRQQSLDDWSAPIERLRIELAELVELMRRPAPGR